MTVGDVAEAGDVFERMKSGAEAAKDDRAVSCAQNGIGDVLKAQGDGPGALAAYQASLAIAEALAKRDPANTEWQVDLACSCGKLGTLKDVLSVSDRRSYLERGKQIILELKQSGRLHPNQDTTAQFNEVIQKLDLEN
ncbi:MAG: hypothetical protein ACK59A_13290 [Cyanobacteriota bacterium]